MSSDRDDVDANALAAQMLFQAAADGQSVRTVLDDADADAVRKALRVLARVRKVAIRTARVDSAVVVVRVDASLWTQDAATMRQKLTPPQGDVVRGVDAVRRLAR